MRNLYALVIFFSITCAGCDEADRGLTYQQFERHLKKEMSYQQILFRFGKPLGDIGSGIHIYVYKLTDKSTMHIGHTDHVIYAKHVSEDGQLLHVLIE